MITSPPITHVLLQTVPQCAREQWPGRLWEACLFKRSRRSGNTRTTMCRHRNLRFLLVLQTGKPRSVGVLWLSPGPWGVAGKHGPGSQVSWPLLHALPFGLYILTFALSITMCTSTWYKELEEKETVSKLGLRSKLKPEHSHTVNELVNV